jgi:DNA-binding transcriptional MerR regulator
MKPAGIFADGIFRYSTKEVAFAARTTVRNLQWWDETGVVCPEQYGHRRFYTESQLEYVMIVAELRRQGMRLDYVRAMLDRIRERDDDIEARPRGWIVTDGVEVKIHRNSRSAMLCIERWPRRRRVCVVSIQSIQATVRAAAALFMPNKPQQENKCPSVNL